MSEEAPPIKRPWDPPPPGKFIGHGHTAGDFLEAFDWNVLDKSPGSYRLDAHLPPHVKNVRGHMFGGFAPTYIDLLAVRTAASTFTGPFRGFATVNMRVDYFEPVVDERFVLESRIVNHRGQTFLVEVVFKDLAGKLMIYSIVTLRQRA